MNLRHEVTQLLPLGAAITAIASTLVYVSHSAFVARPETLSPSDTAPTIWFAVLTACSALLAVTSFALKIKTRTWVSIAFLVAAVPLVIFVALIEWLGASYHLELLGSYTMLGWLWLFLANCIPLVTPAALMIDYLHSRRRDRNDETTRPPLLLATWAALFPLTTLPWLYY